MVNLKWCKNQETGIKIIEPNHVLSEDYMKSAEETLVLLKEINHKSNMWEATMKYYCEYFAIYSLLLRIGIKCEIHDCTIKICEALELSGILPKGTFKILEKDKGLRIENQYYLKNTEVNTNFPELSDFVLKIKNINYSLTFENIKEIRKSLV
jgi:uncharacterized protein (UPF0332 family)